MLLIYSGCSEKHKQKSYEEVCISKMLEDENFRANPNGGAIAKDICRCSAATYVDLSEQSKSEYMDLESKGKAMHLSDPKDDASMKAAMTDCAMQAVVHQLQSAGE
ncbi:MAG TPA: hypothetical protein ENL04_03890 [Sulfuricurvum sp.]|nr:hypothetical protein [Sulfuricurvum sp.]